ncbi:hypothetical protein [Sphaerisporangium sp. TRM90804]|uniref:ATP-binding protein n=1 Tax=Sphaerisporangium sp. TRM90804 TaxID=3031113 RepID=UPI00244D3B40|nr:hypothetical protein [Sphaerisporangium sp. TRM90804]MDH2424926.1 hypothetical protein [Sphaerisporangium sp. TRM90804]
MRPADTGPADVSGGRPHDDLSVLVRILPPGSASRRARAVIREALQGAGVREPAIGDAEIVVAELAANCERHARQPYELRVLSLGDVPIWCEIVDADPDLGEVSRVLDVLRLKVGPALGARDGDDGEAVGLQEAEGVVYARAEGLDLFAESGRGLLLAYQLSDGRCRAYPTRTIITGAPAKAVAFALPTRSGEDLPLPHLVDASFSCGS